MKLQWIICGAVSKKRRNKITNRNIIYILPCECSMSELTGVREKQREHGRREGYPGYRSQCGWSSVWWHIHLHQEEETARWTTNRSSLCMLCLFSLFSLLVARDHGMMWLTRWLLLWSYTYAGMSREVFALLGNNLDQLPSIVPAAPASMFKARHKGNKATKWERSAFTSSARDDGLNLKHWVK